MNHQAKQTLRNHPNHGKSIYHEDFQYTPSYATDIKSVFLAMGWVPPSIKKQTMRYDEYAIETKTPF